MEPRAGGADAGEWSADMSTKLLPCPFCGVELYACTYDGGKTRHAHEVNGCVLDRKFVQGLAQESSWNRRAALAGGSDA